MSYKIQLTLGVTLESKQDADRLVHRFMVDMENYAENYDGVLSAVARRNELDKRDLADHMEAVKKYLREHSLPDTTLYAFLGDIEEVIDLTWRGEK